MILKVKIFTELFVNPYLLQETPENKRSQQDDSVTHYNHHTDTLIETITHIVKNVSRTVKYLRGMSVTSVCFVVNSSNKVCNGVM